MPFPFLPAGIALAASVLIGALVGFGMILRAMDRAIGGLRDNMLSGLVSGIRTWGRAGPERLVNASPGASSGSPWSGPETTPTAEATPSPEIIDLGSRPITRQPDNKR